MTAESEMLLCSTHGESHTAFVCQHLMENSAQPWCCDYPSEGNPWPDAWCGRCDVEFLKQGEWNEKNGGIANIKLLCSSCYERHKGESVACMDTAKGKEWKRFRSECCEELTKKNEHLWERLSIDSYQRWDWNQDSAEIVFSNDGVPGVTARIAFVGSFSKASDTWLWAWANFGLDESVRTRAIAVRDYGETKGFLPLTIPKWSAKQEDGWHMAAIAARILGAEGVYCTPGDSGFTFMVLLDARKT